MRRIYTIYTLNKILSKTAFKIYTGFVFLYGIKIFVHVKAVLNNMPDFNDFSGLYNFMTYATLNTDTAVQFIVFGTFALFMWIMRDAIKKYFRGYNHNTIQNRIHI